MKIVSDAGNFDIEIHGVDATGDKLRMAVKMGVWDAEMQMSSRDFGRLLIKALRPSVLLFFLLLPLRAARPGAGRA